MSASTLNGSTGASAAGKHVLAFTGGGTGGHIYPGLAIIESLRARGFEGRVLWIGSNKPLDRAIVEHEGIEYAGIPSGKLRRSLSIKNVLDVFKVVFGYFSARRILRELNPDLLVSKGGYVSVPPCKAAASLGIPYLTHESDASPGLATKLNAGKADSILVSWPHTVESLSPELRRKTVITGNPVRLALLEGSAEKGRTILGAPREMPIVLFVGGSQGSRQVNDIVERLLPDLDGKVFVAHQTGKDLYDPARHLALPGRYSPLSYIAGEMRDILAASHIVVGRAGAGTIWECAAMGKPMVLIPLSGAGTRGDQVENALLAEKAGAARCLAGEAATPEAVLRAILDLVEDRLAWERARDACRALAQVQTGQETFAYSADYIAELILKRLSGSPGGHS